MSAEKKITTKRGAKHIIPLTPQEQAEVRANRILELRKQIDQLEAELSAETDELVAYINHTGQEDFQALKAIRRFGAARLVGEDLTPKELAYAEEQLMNELPDFVKKALDTTKMFNALKTNAAVANALQAKGLSFEQKTSWTLKVKAEK